MVQEWESSDPGVESVSMLESSRADMYNYRMYPGLIMFKQWALLLLVSAQVFGLCV